MYPPAMKTIMIWEVKMGESMCFPRAYMYNSAFHTSSLACPLLLEYILSGATCSWHDERHFCKREVLDNYWNVPQAAEKWRSPLNTQIVMPTARTQTNYHTVQTSLTLDSKEKMSWALGGHKWNGLFE